MFNFFGPKCQSCGMPLSKDKQGGGTNADGSKSTKYCSHCYLNGQFTQPNLTAEQMQERVQNKMKEMGLPSFISYFFTRGIPTLQRWQKK